MDVQTCFYDGDKLSERIAKYLDKTFRVDAKPHFSIDYSKPFIFINGSNTHHNRTLEFVRPLIHVDGYVHVDNHDDIAILSGGSRLGSANFVESILALGKVVIFVGQNYWSHEVVFRGEKQIMLLRNNLCRYKPLRNIYFLSRHGSLVFCPMNAFDQSCSVITDALSSFNIQRIFLLDECASKIPLSNKIELYRRDDLQWNPNFPELYPAFILKWRGYNFANPSLNEVYVSIDLDVLKVGYVECDWQDNSSTLSVSDVIKIINQISQKSKIVAADICGAANCHKSTLRLMTLLYECLRKSITRSHA